MLACLSTGLRAPLVAPWIPIRLWGFPEQPFGVLPGSVAGGHELWPRLTTLPEMELTSQALQRDIHGGRQSLWVVVLGTDPGEGIFS